MNRTHSVGWAAIVVLSALFGSAHGGNAASTAAFAIVAGQGGANGGNNFNGVDKGRLTIAVPVGAQVKLTLANKGDLPHSLQIIPFTTRPSWICPRCTGPASSWPTWRDSRIKRSPAFSAFPAIR